MAEVTGKNKPEIMGILNVTPDSFSDGGQYFCVEKAIERAEQMISEGADWIDIGGESTRPGAQATLLNDELNRILPVVSYLAQETKVKISIDTSKVEVMQACLEQGAHMINDVRALQMEGAVELIADFQAQVCLMHMQGEPRTMQANPFYKDVVEDISHFFKERLEACEQAGIQRSRIWLDPGFGFGKTTQHNYELLVRLKEFEALQQPLLVGMSRKTMLGDVTGKPATERVAASVTAAVLAAQQQVDIVRVHDVAETKDALMILQAFQAQIN